VLIFVLQILGHIVHTVLILRIVYGAEMILSLSFIRQNRQYSFVAGIHYLCPESMSLMSKFFVSINYIIPMN
jgi:hypothetical protein